MVDVASITVAVISLVASITVAIASGIITAYNDDRKARRETDVLLRKYRDPLLLAAQDLQARLYNLINSNIITNFMRREEEWQDTLFIYTAFLVGQYLSWTWILRRQAQFLCFASDKKSRSQNLISILDRIKAVLNEDSNGRVEAPFMLWKGHQAAIGELMSVADDKEGRQMYCMGFSTFTHKWKAAGLVMQAQQKQAESGSVQNPDVEFRKWFRPVEDGIRAIHDARQRGDRTPENRLRRLQHLMLDLAFELDPDGVRRNANETGRVAAAPRCHCSTCDKEVKSAHRSDEEAGKRA